MNRVQRYVAAENVSEASMKLVGASHNLWKAAHTFKAGLTPKELELIEKKREELVSTQLLLSKIAHRVRQSGTTGF